MRFFVWWTCLSALIVLASATLDGARRFAYLDGMLCLQEHEPVLADVYNAVASPDRFNLFLAGLRAGRAVCQSLASAAAGRYLLASSSNSANPLAHCLELFPRGRQALDMMSPLYACLTVTARMEVMANAASRDQELADEANTVFSLNARK